MTAYFGMRQCGPLMPRDAVLVAGATGSVGSIAAQLARIAGAYVVGFAAGEDRCTWARRTLSIDDCIDYRAADLPDRLRHALPDGIDVYSDGVGGPLTKTVVGLMNRHGRLFAYGIIAPQPFMPTGLTRRRSAQRCDACSASRRSLRHC
jgi:NADPH-dependent curcumin reductase CurA